MKFPKIALAAAAGLLALVPVAVTAQETYDDTGSDIVRAGIIAAIAGIGMAVLLLADDDDDEIPVSV